MLMVDCGRLVNDGCFALVPVDVKVEWEKALESVFHKACSQKHCHALAVKLRT